jgi:hypothetical protein
MTASGQRTPDNSTPEPKQRLAPWVAIPTNLPDDPRWFDLSTEAKLAYFILVIYAKRRNVRDWLNLDHLKATVPPPYPDHVAELVRAGMLSQEPESVGIPEDEWEAFRPTYDRTNANRQRRSRERKKQARLEAAQQAMIGGASSGWPSD